MNVLIAVGAVNALFFAFIVLMKKERSRTSLTLALLLIMASLSFGVVFLALEHELHDLLLCLVFSNMLLAPLFYQYVTAMVSPATSWTTRQLWHLAPATLAYLYLIVLLSTSSESEIARIFQYSPHQARPALLETFELAEILAPPVYLALSWRLLRRHQRRLGDRYSYTDSVDYAWLRRLVIAMTISWGIIDLPLLGSFYIEAFTETQALLTGFSAASILVLYLGYHGYCQATTTTALIDPEPPELPEKTNEPRYHRSGLGETEIEQQVRRLLELMQSERPYLESKLTIRELAKALGLSEHNTSEVINVGLGKSFYDFVNGYRVAELKRTIVLAENANQTLLAMAMRCGFSSKSSFNRVFKQHTGMTPSAFLRSHRAAPPAP